MAKMYCCIQFCDREEEIGRSGGSTSDIGVQYSDIMSADGLQNTGRLQTRIHQIKQTMIDHYSTMVWCEHRVIILYTILTCSH